MGPAPSVLSENRRPRGGGHWWQVVLLMLPVLLALALGPGSPRSVFATQVTLTVTPTSAQPGVLSTFNAIPSVSCGTGVTTYWQWGDGSTGTQSSGAYGQHLYQTSGQFTVYVTYNDACGNTGSGVQTVAVGQGTGGGCTTSGIPVQLIASPSSGSVGTSVTLFASVSGAASTYQWNFGDGQSNVTQTNSTPHVYTTNGTFTATVNVSGPTGVGCGSTVVTIGGGGTGGTGNVRATANGPYSGPVNQPISMTGYGVSLATGATIISYTWSFGDGTSGSGQSVTHAYTVANTYTVTLTATDTTGQTGSATTTATVGGGGTGTGTAGCSGGVGTATAAGLTANTGGPYSGSAGTTINFNATASTTNPSAAIVSYVWSFGDSSSGTGQQTTHTYSSNGTFSVALTVTDSTGAVVTAITCATIAGGNRSVPLVTGCDNVASTFPNNTPTSTVVAAVSPQSALLSAWKLTDPISGKYAGYFPGASQASDLQNVNRLDAIFICVSGPATFSEPSA